MFRTKQTFNFSLSTLAIWKWFVFINHRLLCCISEFRGNVIIRTSQYWLIKDAKFHVLSNLPIPYSSHFHVSWLIFSGQKNHGQTISSELFFRTYGKLWKIYGKYIENLVAENWKIYFWKILASISSSEETVGSWTTDGQIIEEDIPMVSAGYRVAHEEVTSGNMKFEDILAEIDVFLVFW